MAASSSQIVFQSCFSPWTRGSGALAAGSHGDKTITRQHLVLAQQQQTMSDHHHQQHKGLVLIVVGGGAAGIFGAIKAKSLCPYLDVRVYEKHQLLSKVKVSGGGRCNITTGLFDDPLLLSGQYPRGYKELRGSFFRLHGPKDTAQWFSERGVSLKIEEDGRMFPASNSSQTIIDCLLQEAQKLGVLLQTGMPVVKVSSKQDSTFSVQIGGVNHPRRSTEDANFVLLATGSSQQGYRLAKQLGHSLINPLPSLFTFKVADKELQKLSGVSFAEVRAELEVLGQKNRNPKFNQVGPMLVTHWGLSGPVVLRLSAWAARELFIVNYQGTLLVDFVPKLNHKEVINVLKAHKKTALRRKLGCYAPYEFPLVRRFWEYLLVRAGISQEDLWATLSNMDLQNLAALVKRCSFSVCGKGEFKDEFVTAGGVPLIEVGSGSADSRDVVDLNTMESRICPHLFFAGEILNVDGVTGGFNFQNAWTGGYIAGASIASQVARSLVNKK